MGSSRRTWNPEIQKKHYARPKANNTPAPAPQRFWSEFKEQPTALDALYFRAH